ncbi:MAG TPA: phenylacetate--CoA ligase family protein [Chloroflexi bacterium]|nr:phenylacetate--CoA ligase family protein [Chloroflexota bacterium]
MYAKLYRAARLLLPGGLATQRNERQLEATEWLSRAELEAWQLERIQRLVRYAYEHVPFYRETYRQAGVHPEDIRRLEDFQALPFLTKEDVKRHREALVAPNFRGKLYPLETGGSTGQPTQFLVEDSFWRWNVALRNRGRGWYGVREGAKMALVWGAPRDMPDQSWFRRLRARIQRHRVLNAFSMTEAKMETFAEMLVHWQPAMIKAYASALALFAEFLKTRGITGIRPRLVETTAEKVTGPQRQLLKEVFQCPVADCYSSREFVTIAYECARGGLHVCETRCVEIVADGRVVPPGQLGEIVVTSLHQFAMPFIRYKIGDMGIYDTAPCPCGRGMPVLREVVGRTHDFLVASDGQFVHGEFFAYTFRVKPEVVRYQVHQTDRHHLDVKIVCREPVSDVWLDGVRAEIQARFGESMHISLQVVDKIELTPAGKHRYIISEVNPDFV